MKNPLKNELFNRFEATNARSPLFRFIVILLILIVTCFIAYMISSDRDTSTDLTKEFYPGNGDVSTK